MKKIVILINDTTYAFNLRGAIIRKLIAEGYKVVVVGKLLEHVDKLETIGCTVIGVEPGRHGTNPVEDIKLLKTYRKILKIENPDLVLSYNIKPNVYGGIACKSLKIPYMPNITGLGTPVEKSGPLQRLAILLYKMGVSGAKCVFFQNADNRQFFYDHKMLKKNTRTIILPGSGVDIELHPLLPWHAGPIHFLYAARIMKEKGIDLFIEAAHKFASDDIIFDVCGQCDDEQYTELLNMDDTIRYHGLQSDLTPFYEMCSCFLYPSYYPEGMSNVLLEAAASGRPIIATDRPGCRETVDNGITGYLIPVKDSAAVLQATQKMIQLSDEERKEMGNNGRKKMEKEFDRSIVVQKYWEEITRV